MLNLGLWQIKDNRPGRIVPSKVKLEQDLENWIECDPNLLQAGLTLIGRQVRLKGGIADLLAIDTQGRLVVIEIKREYIRRETIAQALDYASCIAELTTQELKDIVNNYKNIDNNLSGGFDIERILKNVNKEDLEISVFVVGTGQTPDLERMINFLSKSNLSITLVSFEIFQLFNGETVLIRELTETDSSTPPSEAKKRPNRSINEILKLADENDVGKDFRRLHEMALELNLYPRPYKYSIMYTHPSHRNRMLFTMWANIRPKELMFISSSQTFAEFYPITQEEFSNKLGPDVWRSMKGKDVDDYIEGLKMLFTDNSNNNN